MSSVRPPPDTNSFKQQTVRAIGWSWIGHTGRQGVTLLVTLGLARLIEPEHFGLLAMVLVFSEFAVLLAEAGFGAAIVQRKHIEPRHLDAVFWANVTIGLALSIATACAAPWIARFYGEAALEPLATALAPIFVLSALSVVQHALLLKALAFERIARIEIVATSCSGVVAVIAAIAGFGIGALVLQQLVLALVTTVLQWRAGSFRPAMRFEWSALRELSGYSGHLIGVQAFNYWTRNADNLLIGRFVGAAALGFYSHAYRIMVIPLNQVTRALQRVMFPAMSRIKDDPRRVGEIWLRANAIIALTTMPIVCALFVLADPAVAVALGPTWLPVAPILQLLCIAAIKQPMGATTGWIYQSQGRTRQMFGWGVATGSITIAGFVIGLQWGAVGVAASYAITRYVTWYHGISIPGRLVDVTFGRFVANAAGPFACSVAMAAAVWLVGLALPARMSPFVDLAIRVPFGVLVYLGLIRACRLRAWQDLRQTVGEQRVRFDQHRAAAARA